MSRGRRLAMMEEQNFQIWLENNWDRPLSDEVERLQDELKRLENARRADLRRLHKADATWWSLIRKGFLGCLGLTALLLWYMNSYFETRGALREACTFIRHGLSVEIKEHAVETLPEDLKAANSVCTLQASR